MRFCAVIVVVAETAARGVRVHAMLIPTAEADNGVYDGTNYPDREEEEPGCNVDPDGLP